MTRWRTHHRGLHGNRGAAAVEFALVLVVLLLILLGIIDFGRLLYVNQAVKSASREGARAAVISTTSWASASAVAASAAAGADALDGNSNSITVSYAVVPIVSPLPDPPCATADSITVTVTSNFKWITPVGALPGLSNAALNGSRNVVASTTMRCE